MDDDMQRPSPAVFSVLLAVIAALLTFAAVHRSVILTAQRTLDQSLVLTARAVTSEIERFQALPDVASEDARIRYALISPSGLDAANRYLQAVAAHAGAADLYLIDASGLTIAASNWDKPGSFVGQNYGFRPYFRQAMETGHGQFYAIGVTTGIPGFFLSTRIQIGNKTGVLVIKVDLRPLQDAWRQAGTMTALADADGVVFLTGRSDWLYRPLWPLSDQTLAQIAHRRTYEGVSFSGTAPLMTSNAVSADVSGSDWIGRSIALPGPGWLLVEAQSTAGMRTIALGSAVAAALLALALAIAIQAWDQRRQFIALRLSQSEQLEAMVAARTADLAREVEARTQAETDLRAAQEHLIHTEKMAALGRMSTAIVHEISQPLAAMEATLAAAEMTLPAQDTRTAPRLATARGLIKRMQRTTKNLKSFGRKEVGELVLIDLRPVVTSALELVTPRARAMGIDPGFTMPDTPVRVIAGTVRMEQVLVNMLLNALDACEGRSDARVSVFLGQSGDQVHLTVADTGHGITPQDLARVTEPFFTTKTHGEGLGLGLSISRAILAEFGGDMTLQSEPQRGTTVTVTLPAAKDLSQ